MLAGRDGSVVGLASGTHGLAGRGESVVGLVTASWGQMQGSLTLAMP